MKTFILFLSILFFFSSNSFSAEKSDCSNLKKFSIQYTWCKSKNAGKAVKNKLGSLKKNKTSKN